MRSLNINIRKYNTMMIKKIKIFKILNIVICENFKSSKEIKIMIQKHFITPKMEILTLNYNTQQFSFL